ncbi:MAG: hypothetical protein ACR2MD_15115 [Aridibacter sp.]
MKEESKIMITPEGHKIKFRESESVELSLNISKDTLELLEEVAKTRDLSVKSIIKFFVSKGLRDLEPELTKKLAIKRLKSRKVSNIDVEVDLAA